MTIRRVQDAKEERPLQLVNKTNQFNLNGYRDTPEVWAKKFLCGQEIYQISLRDRWADYGGIAVLILARKGDCLEVLQWVMSCRVFSRDLEYASLQWLVDYARSRKLARCGIRYVSTARNRKVGDFLVEAGWPQGNLAGDVPVSAIVVRKKFQGQIKEMQ